MNRPGVGVGIIIENDKGQILVGKRLGHAPPNEKGLFSIPGGHLENGETFEAAAIKEVFEETSLIIKDPKVFCVTNNLKTFELEEKHYVSINLYTNSFEGEAKVKEPAKCAEWIWCDIHNLPQPHFDASEYAIACFREKSFYVINV